MNANHMFFFCSHLFVPSENNQSKKSVLLCGAEVFCVIEIVSAQIQARCAQLSCCNTTTQSAAASGAHEHFWHVVIPPDMVGKLIFHRSRKGNDKETNQFLFLFIGTIVSYFSCDRLQPWRRRTESVIGLCCLYTFTTKLWKHKPASEENSVRFFKNERWSLRSCIHVSELLPLGVCVTTFDTEYWSHFFNVFCIFVAELHFLSSFCTGFLRYLSKVIYKVFVNYFSNNSILGPHWPLLHDAKIISIIDQIGSVLRRRPHYSQQSYRNKTWCDEQTAGGWLMSYWATKSCYIGFVLNCVEQKKNFESSNSWQKTTLKSLNFLRADH